MGENESKQQAEQARQLAVQKHREQLVRDMDREVRRMNHYIVYGEMPAQTPPSNSQ